MTEHINQANEQALRVLGKEAFLFHQGNSHDAHDYLGVHREGSKTVFRVWAPHADAVFVCGDFNAWSPDATPMRRLSPLGVWEASLPSKAVLDGQRYKYRICNGEQVAGFKEKKTGHFEEIMLIRSERDLQDFKERYGIEHVKKEY